ncbi:MAG: hypothetical protein JNM88_07540 [Chitinophagaceae bacterium]|nr:hypothetical protein [Chitinophagaceae bacterium]
MRQSFFFKGHAAILLLSCFALLYSSYSFAQKAKADSLRRLLQTETNDTVRIKLLWSVASAMNRYKPDSALVLAQQALYEAQHAGYLEGESRSLGVLANTFMKIGNYPRSLELNLQKLQLEEKRNVPRNLASVLMNIGIVYALQEEYRQALAYYSKADSVITAAGITDIRFNINLNTGDTYNKLNVSDSAYLFFTKSLQYAREDNNPENTGIAMTGLGHSYQKLGSYSLAMQHYKEALQYLGNGINDETFSEAALGLAELYSKMQRYDSAGHFGHLSMVTARNAGFNNAELLAANFLAQHYQTVRNIDSAFAYINFMKGLNDSLNSRGRIREAQIITTNEQFRQAELEEARILAKKKRMKQLQWLLIGIFIPGIFLLTLLLSRVRVHPKVVRLLGVISLLFLFEYLTLLLHPVVADFTHHTPIYEILVFVGIAALVVPLHHKLEHWMIHKLSHYHGKHHKPVKSPPAEKAVK